MTSTASNTAPTAAVLLALLSITLGASLATVLFPVVGALGATTLRLVIAAAVLVVLLRTWRIRPDRRAWGAALAYGVSMAGMNVLYYFAIERIALGVAIAFEFTGPLAVALWHSRRRLDLLWVVAACAGLLLLVWPAAGAATALSVVGVACALGAGVFWGAYIIVGQRAGAALGVQAPALGILVAAALVLPLGLLAEPRLAQFTPALLLPALGVALLSSAIPYSLEMFALRRLPARTFGILMSAEPAMGALVGLALLGQQLSGAHWLGIAAIMLASVGTTLADRRQPPLPP